MKSFVLLSSPILNNVNPQDQGFPTWGMRLPRGTQEVVKGDASVKKNG